MRAKRLISSALIMSAALATVATNDKSKAFADSEIAMLPGTAAVAESITIDATAPTRPFPHFWEHMFGSCHAVVSLRESYRNDLRKTKQNADVKYVRFHGIFNDETGFYDEDKDGKPVYNFSYIDQIYDGLLDNGVRPFVELGFMPAKLASSQKAFGFWYKPIVAPPKDWDRWSEAIKVFTKHLVDRYGEDEVSKWYFEVWNEPNIDFWGGEPKEATYYKLYDVTANAVKSVNPRLRVGGPSTAQAAWVDRFIAHCAQNKTPVDFISTHVYANDTADNVFGTKENIPRRDMVARAVRKVHDQVQSSAMPKLPIIWSEYNASYFNEPEVTDSSFMGPWLANTIRQSDGLTDEMSFWTFSDVFEEGGVVKRPFYGGFGLIAAGGIPKASYNAVSMLHQLGTKRLPVDSSSTLATTLPDGSLALAVWNYAEPEAKGAAKTYALAFNHLKGNPTATIQILDAEHGSAFTRWNAMGKPDFPSRAQQAQLKEAAALPAPSKVPLDVAADQRKLTLTLPPHSLALVHIGGK